MIKSSKGLSSNLLQQLWFERAERTLKHLEHFSQLLESFQYMGDVAQRLHSETTPNLKKSFKEERNEKVKAKKYAHIQEIKKFLELYQTYTIRDYDYWDYKAGHIFALYIEKFETLTNGIITPKESERFLTSVQNLKKLKSSELTKLNVEVKGKSLRTKGKKTIF